MKATNNPDPQHCLIIKEENRLKIKVEIPKIENSRTDMLEAKIQKLERKYR